MAGNPSPDNGGQSSLSDERCGLLTGRPARTGCSVRELREHPYVASTRCHASPPCRFVPGEGPGTPQLRRRNRDLVDLSALETVNSTGGPPRRCACRFHRIRHGQPDRRLDRPRICRVDRGRTSTFAVVQDRNSNNRARRTVPCRLRADSPPVSKTLQSLSCSREATARTRFRSHRRVPPRDRHLPAAPASRRASGRGPHRNRSGTVHGGCSGPARNPGP